MSFSLHGNGVSRGIVAGRAHILVRDELIIDEYSLTAEEIPAEVERLTQAVSAAAKELWMLRDKVLKTTSVEIAAFIDSHLLMLEDAALIQDTLQRIRGERVNAEWALKVSRDSLVAVFDAMEDEYLRTRRDDVEHVINRVQRLLASGSVRKADTSKAETAEKRFQDLIIVADDLSPADTLLMQHHGVAGFITEYGGTTSHTAILARSLGIPAVVGVHQARRYLKAGEEIIVDGAQGVIVVSPDQRMRAHYLRAQSQQQQYWLGLERLKDEPAITQDGVSIALLANIDLPSDFAAVQTSGAQGVGLYRTEYLFTDRDALADEEEHFEHYRQLASTSSGMPITIRTLDLGADKPLADIGTGPQAEGQTAANPALGLRAVRWCLKDRELFIPQLRAILRASAFGKLRLLIPMLATLQEIHQVRNLVRELQADLSRHDIAYDPHLPIGGMIEVPAAAVCADIFIQHLDFLSIGTNDLIQYAIAIDRVNEAVSYLYDPLHPSVLRLIRTTLAAGEHAGKPVAMCGEMAGDARSVRLLLALGLREFSVHPGVLPEVKKIIRESHLGELSNKRNIILACQSGEQVADLLENL